MKEEQQAESQLSDADVVEPIPRTMRPRATALLSRLTAKPDMIIENYKNIIKRDK